MKPKPMKLASERWSDPETGRKVTRLLPRGQEGSHAYFTSTSFDSRGDLILSIVCEDKPQLCRVEHVTGKAEQITDLDAMHLQSYCVSPAIDCALVIDDERLVRVWRAATRRPPSKRRRDGGSGCPRWTPPGRARPSRFPKNRWA